MMTKQSKTDIRKVLDLIAGEVTYADPKGDVHGAMFRDDRILLVKECADGPGTLLDGWADVNELPGEAVVREVREEGGYRTRAAKLLAVGDRGKHPHYPPFPFQIFEICILCQLWRAAAATIHETENLGFHPADGLPELFVSRVTPGQITRLLGQYRVFLPTDFDG